jgi:hypothetical protein
MAKKKSKENVRAEAGSGEKHDKHGEKAEGTKHDKHADKQPAEASEDADS